MRRLPAALRAALPAGLLAGLLAGSTLVLAPPAAAQDPAAPPLPPVLSGTLLGSDGRAVNGLLGFDWLDAQGRHLHRTGCAQGPDCPFVGYGAALRVNPQLTAHGTADTATASTTWEVQPPRGAVRLFLEAYPQDERYRTSEARYGHAMRHGLDLPHDGPLHLRLPLVHCAEGGSVGTVRGTGTRAGAPVPLARVVAWSLEAPSPLRPVLGWNIGTAREDGTFEVPNLVSDQRYQVWVTAADGTVRKATGVRVPHCAETVLPVAFDEPTTATVAPPAPTLPRPLVLAGESAVVEGAAAPGAVVEVLAATRPETALRVVRRTTAFPSGHWAVTVAPSATTELRVRTGGAQSAPALLRVRTAVRAAAGLVAPRTVEVSGRLLPGRAQQVALQLRQGDGRLRPLAVARAGADGRYRFSRRFLVPGTFDLVVTTGGDDRNAAGRSAPVRVRVP